MQTRRIEARPLCFASLQPRRGATLALALAGFVMAGVAVPAAAVELSPLKRVSGQSPFRNCTADDVANQDGVVYPNSEIEPWIDANPANPLNLIAGWQQDRWSNGGARGNASAYSTDGGATWRTVTLPKVTRCTGGPFARASDPWVSISPNGTAYFMNLAFEPDLPSGSFGRNAMLVSRSTNGGRTWSDPIYLVDEPAGQVLHDKNSLTADPTNSSYAYAVWDRLRDFTLPPGPSAPALAAARTTAGAGDGVVAARQRAQLRRLAAAGGQAPAPQAAEAFFEGPVTFTRTTNGGQSWEPIREVYDPGPNAQTINNLIVVQPDGTLFDFFTEIIPNGGTRIGFIRSFNKGATFTGPSYAPAIATVNGAVTPDSQELIRDASILFDVAVNKRNGDLYLAWQDVRFRGLDEIAFSMSRDDGNTWSAPVFVNKTPRNVNPLREQAIVPSIEVADDGTLVVTYYDFRFDTDNGRERTDFWAVFCKPAHPNRRTCTRSEDWGGELRLTNSSFDLLRAPIARGYFLGDYMGLVATRNSVHSAFGIADAPGQTSIYTRAGR